MSTDTHVKTRCPYPECHREYRVNAAFIGKTVTCKGCGHSFVIAISSIPHVSSVPAALSDNDDLAE